MLTARHRDHMPCDLHRIYKMDESAKTEHRQLSAWAQGREKMRVFNWVSSSLW